MSVNISYVMPVYNSQTSIYKSLVSLIEQSVPGQIIVIDDGSTDNTRGILEVMTKKYDGKFELIRNAERKGAAVCRNIGNKYAKGDVIAVCDADYYYKDRGAAIQEFFEKDLGDVFYSALHIQDPVYPWEKFEMGAYEWDFNSKCPISHPTVAYKKEWAIRCPYHEETKETCLYEFALLDMHRAGAKFSGCQNPLMLKIDSTRKRDKSFADKYKKAKYLEYDIQLEPELAGA